MFGFVRKKDYELLEKNIKELNHDISILDGLLEQEKKINDKLKKSNSEYEELIGDFDRNVNTLEKENTNLKNQLDTKEKQRRKVAGKYGNCNRKLKKFVKERKDMMDLINNLIIERQKILKLKKKPTIEEMRNYFKKH